MSVRDLKNNVEREFAIYEVVTSDGTLTGQPVIDTADYDSGLMFDFAAPVWAAGSVAPVIWQSEDDGATDPYTMVDPDVNLIGTYADATVSAAIAPNDSIPTLGVVGNKRYLRLRPVASGTADMTYVATVSKIPEVLPVV
jgi:hypothetical protein